MPARLRLSCRALLIVVLVRPDFYAAVRLTIVLFSSPLTLTEFIWPPGLGPSTGLQVLPGPRFFTNLGFTIGQMVRISGSIVEAPGRSSSRRRLNWRR